MHQRVSETITENASEKIAFFNKIGLHYNLVAETVYSVRQTCGGPFNSAYLPYKTTTMRKAAALAIAVVSAIWMKSSMKRAPLVRNLKTMSKKENTSSISNRPSSIMRLLTPLTLSDIL